MASFKHSLLILLIAVLDLVRADDNEGYIFILATILRLFFYWVLIFLLVGIYKCLKYAFRKCARGNGEDPTCEYCDLGSDPF